LCQLQTHAAANEVCGCNALFDPLVGAREQRPRNFKTIKLMTRSKFGRLLDRDVARFVPAQDLVNEFGGRERAVDSSVNLFGCCQRATIKLEIRAGSAIPRALDQ